MEQRHITGKSHWYHETQSSTAEYDVLPLVPEAAKVSDPSLLDMILDEEMLAPSLSWLVPARVLAVELFPDPFTVIRPQTFTAHERLSTTLTVAQVCGVQWLRNYYSVRLTPLPGSDSSRESNHRLAQITRYARQLASLSSIIDSRSRQHLNDVGFTVCDCVVIIQIIGFIGFQVRTIVTFRVCLRYPVRWLPRLEIQDYADTSLFADESSRWRSSYKVEKPPEEHTKSSTAELCQLASTLSPHPILLSLFERLLNSIRVNIQLGNLLAASLCVRINGSPACFAICMDSLNEYKKISPPLRKGENKINRWVDRHSVERATVQMIQWLTRTPDRFSAARSSPLLEHEKSLTQIINLLAWSGLCDWINRLKIVLGGIY